MRIKSNVFPLHPDSVANMSSSPFKESGFTMDPMLEAALDFDDDSEDEGHGDRE